MQKKKKKEQTLVAKTAEQQKFESQWKAGDPQNEDKKADLPKPSTSQPLKPSTSQPLMPPPPSDPREFTDDCYDGIEHFESPEPAIESFNSTRIWPSHNDGIPCLDFAVEETKPKPVNEIPIIDLDPEENIAEPKEPPPLATFRAFKRPVTRIEEIIEEPGRSKRHQRYVYSYDKCRKINFINFFCCTEF